MQNGALLGDVDFFTREHGVNVPAKTGLLRKVNPEADRFRCDSVLA